MVHRVQRKAGFVPTFTLQPWPIVRRCSDSHRLGPNSIPDLPNFATPLFGLSNLAGLIVLCFSLAYTGQVLAGLSASEVVVAVNGNSINSRTLANHFAQLRNIPSINIVVLNNIPDREQITVQEFRDIILLPMFREVEARKIAGHIQCIAYSADFPTAIDISQDTANLKDLHTVFTKVASINGLTYLYDLTIKADPTYITPEINFYARRVLGAYFTNPGGKETEALWADYGFHSLGKDFDKAGQSLDKLVEMLPYQYPLKYLAAGLAAQNDQPEKAVKLLEEAIAGGWSSGGYLANDSRFDAIRDDEEFQGLNDLLEPDSGAWQKSVAFNARSAWAANGVEFPFDPQKNNLGMKYLLSTVLGVTRGAGNSLEEAVRSLHRAKAADFTHPQGGFYFSATADVRAQTRKPNFALAVDELSSMGFEAEIIYESLPNSKKAVLGAQIGIASFDWKNCSSSLVPGAIVENLTSLGGVMTLPNSQTPLTHLIAAGAAGSSGTVTEPYSVQFKFPTPHLYVHYANGLSLAEAFYQSVTGPYQLLVVGDPLCQPFSIAPNHAVDARPQVLQSNGTIQLQPDLSDPSYFEWLSMSQPPGQRKVQLRPAKIAVQIDGGAPLGGIVQPTVNIRMDQQGPGYHEVQVTAVADDPLKQRFQQVIPVWIGDRDLIKLSLVGAEAGKVKSKSIADETFSVRVIAPEGCKEVAIYHHFEQLSITQPTSATTEMAIAPQQLGMGPVRLQARAKLADDSLVVSQPLWVEIVP